MLSAASSALVAAIEQSRRRLWMVCYWMTGSRSDADDLSQEAIGRAIEREADLAHHDNLEGWLIRIATTVCLDHQRHRRIERRVTELVDPLDLPDLSPGTAHESGPEAATILREDLRFAVMVALQHLPARQRAALILHDVCDQPLPAVAATLGTNANAAKAVLNRARGALEKARHHLDVDPIADREVAERLARAIEMRSIEAITALFADDVWGVVDGGGIVQAAKKPTYGLRAVSRQWANAHRRQIVPVAAHVRRINGEPAVVVTIPDAGNAVMAMIHIETRHGRIAALRTIRDPRKLQHISAGESCR
jgi:RNA polymerase sigma-70 factor (ECF subfamily)